MDRIFNSLFRYPPVNCCIYCGSDGGAEGLTDEHVIPLALGGVWLLPKASCTLCAGIISYVEGYCSRKLFNEFRITENLPSRRKKDRPKTLSVGVNFGDRIEQHHFPIEEFPSTIALPHLPMPGILTPGRAPDHPWDWCNTLSWTKLDALKTFPEGAMSLRLKSEGKLGVLARFLAKIAHAYAIGEFGLGTFRPLLVDLILGRNICAPYLVGSYKEIADVSPFQGHRLAWSNWEGSDSVNGPPRAFLSIDIRLFMNLGFGAPPPKNFGPPTYCVIAGELDRPLSPLKTSITLSR